MYETGYRFCCPRKTSENSRAADVAKHHDADHGVNADADEHRLNKTVRGGGVRDHRHLASARRKSWIYL